MMKNLRFHLLADLRASGLRLVRWHWSNSQYLQAFHISWLVLEPSKMSKMTMSTLLSHNVAWPLENNSSVLLNLKGVLSANKAPDGPWIRLPKGLKNEDELFSRIEEDQTRTFVYLLKEVLNLSLQKLLSHCESLCHSYNLKATWVGALSLVY